MNIITIKHGDTNYPKNLYNIFNPPKILYAIGNIKLLNSYSIAMVGTRSPTKYGIKTATTIAKQLSDNNITVISGLAVGIDQFSHEGALMGKSKKTIAVLGNSLELENLYPKENEYLYKKILYENGCIISEYPPNTKAEKWHFPERNRIISGLSNKILVVEAAKKSGTSITVEYALENGKDIFAVPGNIDCYKSEGCNQLIKDGAFIYTNINDLL